MLVQDRTATGWRLGFQTLEEEIAEAVELKVDGDLPGELDGTLYRVGPARHDVYGERYRHWFDGDGMVHALKLQGGKAHYRNRFVATDKKRDEDAAGHRIYGAFGTPPASRRGIRAKSSANINVVSHGGKLLALWEAGRPWALDPVTLETVGEDDLGGVLAPGQAISAHPKLDRATGEMWNFGVDYGPRPKISLYRTSPDGTTERVLRKALPFGAMIHDFALTPTKAVVVIAPITLPTVPVALLTGRKSYGESLRWRPRKGTRIAVYDRATGEIRLFKTDPFMMFHTVNAWDEDGDVVVDLCAYEDASVIRMFSEVMVGEMSTPSPARIERLRLTAGGKVRRRQVSDTIFEFPRVAGHSLSQPHSKAYGLTVGASGFLGVPAVVDAATGSAGVAPMTPGQFAGEPVPVSKVGATSDQEVWLLTLVLDSDARASELWVLDGEGIEAGPVARVRLPHIVPFGLHGNWVRAG